VSDHSSTTIQFIPPRVAIKLFQNSYLVASPDFANHGLPGPSKASADKEGRPRRQLRQAYEERMEMEREWAALPELLRVLI
jgi:hypothetical protein